jgi:hypothetical protein
MLYSRWGGKLGDDLTIIVESGEGVVTDRPVLFEQIILEIML